jgi:hypothetical protein
MTTKVSRDGFGFSWAKIAPVQTHKSAAIIDFFISSECNNYLIIGNNLFKLFIGAISNFLKSKFVLALLG